jgi:alkylmercury lyase
MGGDFMDDVTAILRRDVSGAAFRRLLTTGAPAPITALAADLGQPVRKIEQAIDEMRSEGAIRIDDQRRVVGAAGLSIGTDRHRVELGGRTFWTWCAYDILGIVGALGTDASAYSASPHSGASLEVRFHQGRPEPTSLVLFRPDDGYMSCCANVYEDWCPNSNFFESREAATTWAAARDISGRITDLAEAAELATRNWAPLASGLHL